MSSDLCPLYAPFFSGMGVVASIAPSIFGASYGMGKAGIGIMAAGVLRPQNMIKSLTPTILAGILSIYGLIISIQITTALPPSHMIPLSTSFIHFSAGLSVGLSALAAGFAIGIVGDAGVRAVAQQARFFVGMILILIFAEVLGLYGMIVGLLLLSQDRGSEGICGTLRLWLQYDPKRSSFTQQQEG